MNNHLAVYIDDLSNKMDFVFQDRNPKPVIFTKPHRTSGAFLMQSMLTSAGKYLVQLERGTEILWKETYGNRPTAARVIRDIKADPYIITLVGMLAPAAVGGPSGA